MADVTVRRVGVWSAAKISGVVGFIFGIIYGAMYAGFILLIGALVPAANTGGAKSVGIPIDAPFFIIALVALVIMPIFFGILSAIFGAIYAFIYNVVSGMVGGIELELQSND